MERDPLCPSFYISSLQPLCSSCAPTQLLLAMIPLTDDTTTLDPANKLPPSHHRLVAMSSKTPTTCSVSSSHQPSPEPPWSTSLDSPSPLCQLQAAPISCTGTAFQPSHCSKFRDKPPTSSPPAPGHLTQHCSFLYRKSLG